jgi:hypothetical protein
LLDHIEVALECGYVNNDEYLKLNRDLEELLALLNGYVKYLSGKKTTQPLIYSTT